MNRASKPAHTFVHSSPRHFPGGNEDFGRRQFDLRRHSQTRRNLTSDGVGERCRAAVRGKKHPSSPRASKGAANSFQGQFADSPPDLWEWFSVVLENRGTHTQRAVCDRRFVAFEGNRRRIIR
jgi:hypothetical protein